MNRTLVRTFAASLWLLLAACAAGQSTPAPTSPAPAELTERTKTTALKKSLAAHQQQRLILLRKRKKALKEIDRLQIIVMALESSLWNTENEIDAHKQKILAREPQAKAAGGEKVRAKQIPKTAKGIADKKSKGKKDVPAPKPTEEK